MAVDGVDIVRRSAVRHTNEVSRRGEVGSGRIGEDARKNYMAVPRGQTRGLNDSGQAGTRGDGQGEGISLSRRDDDEAVGE